MRTKCLISIVLGGLYPPTLRASLLEAVEGCHSWRLSLLKIQFGAIERDKQRRAGLSLSRDPTLIAMVQTADLREGDDVMASRG